MAGYGASRGSNYRNNGHYEYNPMRGNQPQNQDQYSALYYTSNNNHDHNHNRNHNHNHNHNNASLHTVSNQNINRYNNYTNPYQALNDQYNPHQGVNNYPDLTQTRKPPQIIATPTKQKPSQKDSSKGWKFAPFSMIKSVFNKMVGNTPTKPTKTNRRSLVIFIPNLDLK